MKQNECLMGMKFPIGSKVKFSEAGRKRYCNSRVNLDRVFTVVKYDKTGNLAKVSHPAWKLLTSYAVQYLELA